MTTASRSGTRAHSRSLGEATRHDGLEPLEVRILPRDQDAAHVSPSVSVLFASRRLLKRQVPALLGPEHRDQQREEGDQAVRHRARVDPRAREAQAEARARLFRTMLDRFRSMIDAGQLRVRVTRNRMVVELPEGVLFDTGRAEIKASGQSVLEQVSEVLRGMERDFQIAGHTDNVPIRNARFPSNWELSAARALTVSHFLIGHGLVPQRLSAAGYADTQPEASNDSPEGRRQNRRIEIVLVPALDELPDLSALQERAGTSVPGAVNGAAPPP